jgi:hypothetical protein
MNHKTPICAALAVLAASTAAWAGAAEKNPQAPKPCEATLMGERAGDRTVQQDYSFKCAGVAPTTTRISFDRPFAEEGQRITNAASLTRRPQMDR